MTESTAAGSGDERSSPGRRITWAAAALAVLLLVAFVILRSLADSDLRAEASPVPSNTLVASASPETEAVPPGRDDIPAQAGFASDVIVIVDASETDDATAAGIRAGLVDLVQQLPEYDSLTLIATGDTVRREVDGIELDREGRDDAIGLIEGLRFAGPRQLIRGVEVALDAAHDIEPGYYDALLIATGADGSTYDELQDASRLADEDGSGISGLDLHGIAVGAGDHEALLAHLHEGYQWARDGSDVIRALAQYRLVVSESTLLGIGHVPEDDEAVEIIAGPNRFAVRFSVYSDGRSLSVEAESPSGRRYDASSRGEDISVQELGERVSVVINGAEQGAWTVRFTGDSSGAGDAWFEAEETLTLFSPLTTAYGTGDTTDDLRTGIALLHQDGEPQGASARLIAPDGSEQALELATMGNNELTIGAQVTLGTIVDDPQPAGSYSVVVELDVVDPEGNQRHFAWIEGAYVAPERDTDGDGIRDALEQKHGLDPSDPADGAADHDYDGLSTADEMTIHGTGPVEWDTDFGGESDGGEVAAGRDPLDDRDDQPEVSCLELVPTPDPEATPSPVPTLTPEPAPALEALLPDAILGRETEKVSMTAPDRLEFIFGLFEAFLACTGTERSDLSLAVAIAPELRNWSVVAVEIDGVTGAEMQDIWLFRMGGGPIGRLTELEVDGREYVMSDAGWATYATDGEFYWITNLTFGDNFSEPEETPAPIPESDEIIRAIVRQLPLDR